MPSHGLIVVAPVKPGFEDGLRAVLNRIGNDIRGRRVQSFMPEPRIDFPRSRTLHFARMALLDHPAAGAGRMRLLLVTDYDGPWDAHVAELFSLTSDPDAIWGCCEGYTGGDHFEDFIRNHTVSPQAYYIALPGFDLDAIRELIRRRLQMDTRVPDVPGRSIAGRLLNAAADVVRFPMAGLEVAGIVRRRGLFNTLMAARKVNATLDRVWYIRLFNGLTFNSHPAPPHRHGQVPPNDDCAPVPGDEMMSPDAWVGTPAEDLVSQNQLTLVTVVRPEELPRLRAGARRHRPVRATAGRTGLAGRHQHDPHGALGAARRRQAPAPRQQLRRHVGKLHRRVRRDDPLRARRHLVQLARLSRCRRTGRGSAQTFPALPPVARQRLLQRLSVGHRAEHRRRPGLHAGGGC